MLEQTHQFQFRGENREDIYFKELSYGVGEKVFLWPLWDSFQPVVMFFRGQNASSFYLCASASSSLNDILYLFKIQDNILLFGAKW